MLTTTRRTFLGPTLPGAQGRVPQSRCALHPPSPRQSLLARLPCGLQVEELTLRFKVRQHAVAQLRPHSQPTRLSRLLVLAVGEVYIMPGLRALFERASTARPA